MCHTSLDNLENVQNKKCAIPNKLRHTRNLHQFSYFKNYQKSEIKFLKDELKKLKGHFVNLGDVKTIKDEKTHFIELIKSTLNVHFSALDKKTLLMLIDCFYEVQQVEYKLAN